MMLWEAASVDELQHDVNTHHESRDQMTVTSSTSLSRMPLSHIHSLQPCVTLHISSRSPMETMDRARSPDDDLSARTSLHETKVHTLFASFNAASHKSLNMYALLRLMQRPCGGSDRGPVQSNTGRWLRHNGQCSLRYPQGPLASRSNENEILTEDGHIDATCFIGTTTRREPTLGGPCPVPPVPIRLPFGGSTHSRALCGVLFRDVHILHGRS